MSDIVEIITLYLLSEGVLYLEHNEIIDYCISESISKTWNVRYDRLQFKHEAIYIQLAPKIDPLTLGLVPDFLDQYVLGLRSEDETEYLLPLTFFRKEGSAYLIFT